MINWEKVNVLPTAELVKLSLEAQRKVDELRKEWDKGFAVCYENELREAKQLSELWRIRVSQQ